MIRRYIGAALIMAYWSYTGPLIEKWHHLAWVQEQFLGVPGAVPGQIVATIVWLVLIAAPFVVIYYVKLLYYHITESRASKNLDP